MRRYARWVTALTGALVACSQSTAPARPTVTGNWSGTIVGTGPLTLALTDNGGTVIGSGSLTTTTSTKNLTATGTFAAPTLLLTISQGTTASFTINAFVNADSMVAHLNGNGFTGDVVTLKR